MTGNRQRAFTPGPKHLRLLEGLLVAKIVDSAQAGALAGWDSVTRSNVNVLKLKRAGFLNSFRIATEAGSVKALYTLTKKGAALIGATITPLRRTPNSVLIGDLFVQHQLAINDIF